MIEHMTARSADDVAPLGPKFRKLRFHKMIAAIQGELPGR
jgi:hypothetical protein